MKNNVIVEKSFDFAVRIVNLYRYLYEEKKEFVLSKQLLHSGTSIGANIEEAHGGYSEKDFIYKLQLSYKELRETIFWLRLLEKTNYITSVQFNSMMDDANELRRIITSILKSMKEKT